MKRVYSRSLIAVLMLAATAAGFYTRELLYTTDPQHTRQHSAMPTVIGEYRTDFSLPDYAGNLHTVNEWNGRVLVINFWATWCAPCREEIPIFVDLQSAYADQGLQFIGIALETADAVKPFAEQFDINYPALVGETEVIKIAKQYGNVIGGLPYTVVVDREGIVRYRHQGAINRAAVLAEIKKFL